MTHVPDANELTTLRRECEAGLARLARHHIDTEAYWNQAEGLEIAQRELWSSDAQSAHAVAVALWSALDDGTAIEACLDLHPLLDEVRRRFAVVVSELRGRRDPLGRALLAAWERDGRQCVEALAKLGEALGAVRDMELSTAEREMVASLPVLRTAEGRFEIFCATCGKSAVVFEIGSQVPGEAPSLLCKGIVWQQSFPIALAEPLFERLGRGAVDEAHTFLIAHGACQEGIDAWCPPCGRAYCKLHFACEDVYDEGFYDVTYGTCPAGHRRCIAD